MKPILHTEAGNPENQDRGLIIHDGPSVILCVADGAGGQSGGTEAANMAVEFVRQRFSETMDEETCAELLRDMDQVIAKDTVAGETTCALAVLTPEEIFGASVGDSGIWLIPTNGIHTDLTSRQQRKPLLGSGCAYPVSFRHPTRSGLLLLATDGLLKYASAEKIIETCRQPGSDSSAQPLIDLARYSSGAMPDDVTLILTRL